MSWPLRPVSELCDLAVDCVNKTAPVVDKVTPYKMIRTTNVKGGFVDIDEVRYVTKYTFEKWTRRSQPKYGDVILTREAPVGEVGRCVFDDEESVFLGQRLFQYRPNADALDWNFLAYALQSPEVQGRLHAKAFGSTVPHVKVGYAESLLVPCPPIDEQKVIGRTLANYDDLITTNQRRIRLLEEAARRLYREWFVHLRFPGHEQVPVEDGVPKGWDRTTFKSVCLAVGGGTPSTKRPEYWGGDITWVTPTDLTKNDSLFLAGSERKITDIGLEKSSSKLLPAEAILMTSRASIGYFALVDRTVCTNQGFISIVPLEAGSRMYLLFNLRERVDEMLGLATGSTFKELSKSKFKGMGILWPVETILDEFCERVELLFAQMKNLKQQNSQLKQARDQLLPRLMSGQLGINSLATTTNKEEE